MRKKQQHLAFWIRLIFALLVVPTAAFAQGSYVNGQGIVLLGPTGRPLAGATVTICTSAGTGIPCSPTANIFADAGLTVPAANPQTSDGNGNVLVFAAPGNYVYTVTGTGITSGSYVAIVAGTGDVKSGSNNILTGTNTFNGPVNFNNTESHTGAETHSGSASFAGITATSVTDSGLTSGNCVQASTGGLLVTTSGPCGVSAGTVTATGSPAAPNMACFSAATSITNCNLSGDATTAGSSAVTVAKVNGNSVPSGIAAHQALIGTAASTISFKTIPDCQDSSGNHINYTQSSDSFSCGTSSSGHINWAKSVSCPNTGGSAGATTTCTLSLNTSEINTGYQAVCTGGGVITGYPIMLGWTSKGTTTITVEYSNGTNNMATASGWSEVDCIITR